MSEAGGRPADGAWQVERLLADALRPIEPPERLAGRVEDTLAAVTQAAAEELSDWAEALSENELRALRDPRNWVRPVIAVGAGGLAGGALVLIELRRRGRRQASGRLRALTSRVAERL
ncbi:MAG TPA: hypothetical protein VFI63_04265 [Solirubrobacterales bacterium]|nr:hypothetical protein [Solirubrobacterales bacterium]